MATCSVCGRTDAPFVSSSGKCFNCMTEPEKEEVKKHFAKIKAEIGEIEDNSGNGGMSKEEFEKQAEFEQHMRTFVRELRKAKEEDALEQGAENGSDVHMSDDKGAAGTGGLLRPQNLEKERSRKEGFDSNEQMINYLREKAKVDPDSIEAKQLEQLWSKTVKALKESPHQTAGMGYEPKPEEAKEKSSVERALESQNKEWKRRNGLVQEE